MFNATITNAVVSRGYDNNPAVQYSDKGDFARFRFGKKVYDSRAEGNYRWVNMTVKAFGPMVDRIQKMQLKEGSYINLMGRLDEDNWQDKTTGENRSAMVLILDDIEYTSSAPKNKDEHKGNQNQYAQNPQSSASPGREEPSGFTGFEPFGGSSFFDIP